jgi:hypothetical protein
MLEMKMSKDEIGNRKTCSLQDKLQMACDEANLDEDVGIYEVINKFFPGAIQNEDEHEALYNCIADYLGVSNREQCTDKQIALLQAKGYLPDDIEVELGEAVNTAPIITNENKTIIPKKITVSFKEYEKAKDEIILGIEYKESSNIRENGNIFKSYSTEKGTFYEVLNADGSIEFWSTKQGRSRFTPPTVSTMPETVEAFKKDIIVALEKFIANEPNDKYRTAGINAMMTYLQYNLLENGLNCYYVYDDKNFGGNKKMESK